MKSIKTYNMDQDVIRILSRERNKSEYVNKAVRQKAHNIQEVYAADFDTRALCIALKEKPDVPDHIKRELINLLFETM